MYKIIFSDIDGTLLNGDRTLSEATIRQVKRLKNTIPFILVSSRMPDQMYHLQEGWCSTAKRYYIVHLSPTLS